jgi:hypothetical protein
VVPNRDDVQWTLVNLPPVPSFYDATSGDAIADFPGFRPSLGNKLLLLLIMKLPQNIVFVFLLLLSALASAQNKRVMRITELEYHKTDEGVTYRVNGETVPPGDVIYYKLECKGGAAELELGKRYHTEETVERDGTKTIYIEFPRPIPGDALNDKIVGLLCTVKSERMQRRGK